MSSAGVSTESQQATDTGVIPTVGSTFRSGRSSTTSSRVPNAAAQRVTIAGFDSAADFGDFLVSDSQAIAFLAAGVRLELEGVQPGGSGTSAVPQLVALSKTGDTAPRVAVRVGKSRVENRTLIKQHGTSSACHNGYGSLDGSGGWQTCVPTSAESDIHWESSQQAREKNPAHTTKDLQVQRAMKKRQASKKRYLDQKSKLEDMKEKLKELQTMNGRLKQDLATVYREIDLLQQVQQQFPDSFDVSSLVLP